MGVPPAAASVKESKTMNREVRTRTVRVLMVAGALAWPRIAPAADRQPGEGNGYVGLRGLSADAWTDCPAAYREAQTVPLYQHRSMWGPGTHVLPEYFVVGDTALERLRAQKLSEELLAKLAPLRDRKIKMREELAAELGKLLTADEMRRHRDAILIAARGPAKGGRRYDTNLIVPIGPIPDTNGVIYDSDSYPRKPATLVGEPIVVREGKGAYRVEFQIDRADDVEVRVVDAKGAVVRRLGAGVIGLAAAAEPFEGGTLRQRIAWDGTGEDGKPVADGWRVEVGVGLKPRFLGFVGYDRAQLSTYLAGLQIDPKGRVYVWKHTPIREDPVLLRFDREGRYLDMVYPSNPENLAALGKKMEDVCERVEHADGKTLPIWERLLYPKICRWDQFNNIPFVIDPNGKACFIETLNIHSHPPHFPESYAHVFPVEDLDRFWLRPYRAYGMTGDWQILHNFAAATADRQGFLYLACKRFEEHHALTGMMDKNQLATIVKIDPRTQQGVNSFTWLGEKKLDQPRYYLGEPAERLGPRAPNPIYVKHFDAFIDGKDVEPLPEDTATSFVEIQSVDVDDAGNILVVDGLPRRIKMYAADGRWLGDVKGLTVGGAFRPFLDLAEVGHGPDAHFVVTSFRDEPDRSFLLKCRGLAAGRPEVVWSVPLDPRSRYIAVDRNASPNLVWVGNGGGPATFSRVEDLGGKAGAVRHIGGVRDGVFVDPWRVAASRSGKVFVYDYGTRSLVATDAEGKAWKHVEAHPVNPTIDYSERHRLCMHVEARAGDVTMRSLTVNDDLQQVWTSHRPGGPAGYADEHSRWPFEPAPSPGVVAYDFDLERLAANFQADAGGANFVAARNVPMPNPFAQSFRTSNILYDAPFQAERWASSTQGRLIGRMVPRYGRTGELMNWIRLALEVGSGSMTVDSRGNIYVVDLVAIPPDYKGDALFGFPNERAYHNGQNCTADSYYYQRGDRYVTHLSEIVDVVKFGPLGGVRQTGDERWAHRGAGYVSSICGGCDTDVNTLACDGADRIFSADPIHHRVNVLDPAGHLIARIGTYGNAETVPGESAPAADSTAAGGDGDRLGFSHVFSISAAGDELFATDRQLQRVARVRMDYRERKAARVEARAAAKPAATPAPKVRRSPALKDGVAEVTIEAADQVTVGDWDWKGPADLSAVARLERTDTAFRLTVDVTDDKLHADAAPWAPSDGDSVEFYLDVRPPDRRKGNAYEKGVMQIFIAPGLGKTEDRIVISQRAKRIAAIPGMTSVSEKTDKGYRVTATLPFEGLAVAHYAPGNSLRFDVGVNDNDDGLARTKQMMGVGGNNNWMDAGGFGEANFGADR